ncbi:Aminopeptidase N [Oligella sp. MSHR50489EDL]|uniref:aminopeptidase N n=1 Tax=Oligella sp. MSHR50489EDL TaxID=3139409 RepID=UPI003D818F53
MSIQKVSTTFRQDYQAYPFEINKVRLEFNLEAQNTLVHSVLQVHSKSNTAQDMFLNGEELELIAISRNGTPLSENDYHLDEDGLRIFNCVGDFELQISCSNQPDRNKTLMGLYRSGGFFYTQCEAEGFRRITFYPDRPDVMSEFQVTIRALKADYPILLSNGNLLSQEDLADGYHQAVWHDPFRKPSYLFALVAGDFDLREKFINIADGREVLLQIYSDKGTYQQTEWALDSLERAIRWDETRFDLSLDLERFMIVAVGDFNMGAMENKGLNIFNTAYVLAEPQTATDANYAGIESVIGHEYFHNWTGNRVTCRDWFQLSLKEGLTVFRDQEFSADMMSMGLTEEAAKTARAVKRIEDVTILKTHQFPEDAGPMAHPIRPNSYEEISNFYTHTVYEKGAEVIRMLHTILGEDVFQQGIKEYFRRHDGQAVTCDDFVNAMEWAYQQVDANRDLNLFRRWYEQAGTPKVKVQTQYDAATKTFRLSMQQSCPKVGVETLAADYEKLPFHIPIKVALIDTEGKALPFEYQGGHYDEVLLHLTEAAQEFVFERVEHEPIPSLLRNFSAPIIIDYDYSQAQLMLLAAHDNDHYNRWDAVQAIATAELKRLYHLDSLSDYEASTLPLDAQVLEVWRANLLDPALDAAYRAVLLSLPGIKILMEQIKDVDPQRLALAYELFRQALAYQLQEQWWSTYVALNSGDPYKVNAIEAGHRQLKNLALTQLMAIQAPQAVQAAKEQFNTADNMTDRLAALSAMVNFTENSCDRLPLNQFYESYQQNALVIDKWFALQASSLQSKLNDIQGLMAHPAFNLTNPNRARSLIFQFCLNNIKGFHRPDGKAYLFWADQVLQIDEFNPEIAARLARVMDNWTHYAEPYQSLMKNALEQIAAQPAISKNLREIVHKALSITRED